MNGLRTRKEISANDHDRFLAEVFSRGDEQWQVRKVEKLTNRILIVTGIALVLWLWLA